MRRYRIFLYIFLGFSIALLGFAGITYCKSQIPDTIRVKAGTCEKINLKLPALGIVQAGTNMGTTRQIQLNEPVTIQAGQGTESYEMELKLFGIFPIKKIDIEVIEDTMLTPVGAPIGIYVKTQGVLVVDTGNFKGPDGENNAPSKYCLQPGDYIVAMDGNEVSEKKQIRKYVEQSDGKDIIFQLSRKNEIISTKITPKKDENQVYKLGAWLRDSAQGIGTMTYIDSNNHFGALGHGINDMDTGSLLTLGNGILYQTKIISIQKGKKGTPGEITGVIEYRPEKVAGIITSNTLEGIYGIVTPDLYSKAELPEAMPVCLKQEATKGPAKIYCNVDGDNDYYDIEITRITPGDESINRQISFQVTDERLLNLTGGIVQGMSGAPIIKDGKLFGAVTHVLIDDPKKGYGIFIEDMLIHSK